MFDSHLRAEVRIIFRSDASLQIGTGHIMRCLTLADALRERGTQCSFICREHPGNLINLIRSKGFSVHELKFDQDRVGRDSSPSHSAWLGDAWKNDADLTIVGVGHKVVDWLIVDHYALDRRWESSMRSHCRRLMVIDDLADRSHDCDLLLDQNFGRTSKDYGSLLNMDSLTLIGPHYALLRPEFSTLRPQSLARRKTDPQLKNLLITMGGVDKNNTTGKVLDALKICILSPDLLITIVMGPHAPWLEYVRAQASQMPWSTRVLVGVENMAQLMVESDLAIAAAGSTSWEYCCMGLPTIQVALAANQVPVAYALGKAGATIRLAEADINKKLANLIVYASLPSRLQAMTKICSAITQGKGVELVTDYMKKLYENHTSLQRL